jgi:D-alanyl-lipoteichoic acid acyltransferase DltB (MBOAT superfamily)
MLYFLLPHRLRWILLLAASVFFYMFFKPVYILILAFTIVIDYFAGILLEQEQGKKRKKLLLIISIVANVGVLAVFKYFNFLNSNISGLALLAGFKNPVPFLAIALPIGLSFHTFQAMSYTIEVYRGNQKAERHLGIYSLYVMFYPQLVAGPIERPQNMIHQFREKHYFNYNNATTGLRLMMWGLFKKAVIADRLALITDPVFSHPKEYSAITLLAAAIFFSFQIYCDFSGYSDIAIGSARVMGFKLMNNFSRPYSAKSVSEFWQKWHISLSTWFRDYVYIPLGGNRAGKGRRYMNLFIVFLLSGLWHGANFTFVLWGLLHAAWIIGGSATRRIRAGIKHAVGLEKLKWLDAGQAQLVTFLFVTIAWVLFRAETVGDAVYIFKKIPQGMGEAIQIVRTGISTINLPATNSKILAGITAILFMELVHVLQKKRSINALIQDQSRPVRWALYYTVVLAIIYLGIFQNRQFIYFQF